MFNIPPVCQSAWRTRVRVRERGCGVPPEQAATAMVAAIAARAFQMMRRLGMAIACIVDGDGVACLFWLREKVSRGCLRVRVVLGTR